MIKGDQAAHEMPLAAYRSWCFLNLGGKETPGYTERIYDGHVLESYICTKSVRGFSCAYRGSLRIWVNALFLRFATWTEPLLDQKAWDGKNLSWSSSTFWRGISEIQRAFFSFIIIACGVLSAACLSSFRRRAMLVMRLESWWHMEVLLSIQAEAHHLAAVSQETTA